MGRELTLRSIDYARWRKYFSPVFDPLWYVNRRVRYKTQRVVDWTLHDLVVTAFPEVDFTVGMVAPTLPASMLDYSKNSTNFNNARKLDPYLVSHTKELVVALLSPAFMLESGKALCEPISMDDAVRKSLHTHSPDLDGCGEKLEGVGYLPVYDAVTYLDKNASPGWPVSLKYRTKGDVMVDGNYDLEREIEFLVSCNNARAFWSITPKEEVRSIEKLMANNIRTFVSGSWVLNVIGLMGMYQFQKRVVDAWRVGRFPITIGMNMYQRGWHFHTSRMRFKQQGNDAPKWDGRVPPELIQIVVEIVCHFCSPACWPYVYCVARNMVDHPALFGNGVGLWQFGAMPSGASATIFWNSIARLFELIYFAVWHLWSTEERLVSLTELVANLDVFTHGDDSTHGVSDRWRVWFTHDRLNYLYGDVLAWGTYFLPYQPFPVSPASLRYLSHVTVEIKGIRVPMHENRDKVLASIVLGAYREVPDGWAPEAYHLNRFWQIVNTCFPDRDFWVRLVKVGLEYERRYDAMLYYDRSWSEAKGQRKGAEALEFFFCSMSF